jgi:hypothetical protein
MKLITKYSSHSTLHIGYKEKYVEETIHSFTHSFYRHVQNVTIPCRSQELLPFLFVIYFFLPPFSTHYSSILPHFILPSISWSISQILLFPNVEETVNTKFLGLQIDNHVNWKNHIEQMILDLSAARYAVRSMVRISNVNTLKPITAAHQLYEKIGWNSKPSI